MVFVLSEKEMNEIGGSEQYSSREM
jgi:hypothetical protein